MGSAQFVGLGIPKFAMEYFFRQIRIRNIGTYFEEITMKCRITMTFCCLLQNRVEHIRYVRFCTS